MGYDYQTAEPSMYGLLKRYAQQNRNNPTEAESLLGEYLKADSLGVTFKRQHIIGLYIADFICLRHRLIVELDGKYHQLPEQQTSDAERTAWLEKKGYRVLRFTNEELFRDINKVLDTINENLYG